MVTEAMKDHEADYKQLLLKLMGVPGVELALLREYCADMHFDQQKCVLLYLENLLLSWQPKFMVAPNCNTGQPGSLSSFTYLELLIQTQELKVTASLF